MRNVRVVALLALLIVPLTEVHGNPDTGTLGSTASGSVLGQSGVQKVRPRLVDISLPDHQYVFDETSSRDIGARSFFSVPMDTWRYGNPGNVPGFVVQDGTCFGLTKATAEWYKQIVYPAKALGRSLENPLGVRGTVHSGNVDARYRVRPFTAQIDDDAVLFYRLATFFQSSIGKTSLFGAYKLASIFSGTILDWTAAVGSLGRNRLRSPDLFPTIGKRALDAPTLMEDYILPATRDPSLAVADLAIDYDDPAGTGAGLHHALLVTRVVEGEAIASQEAGRGTTGTSFEHRVRAIKLEIYDSNCPVKDEADFQQRSRAEQYLLYYPDARRLGFPRGPWLSTYEAVARTPSSTSTPLQGEGPYLPRGALATYNIHGNAESWVNTFQRALHENVDGGMVEDAMGAYYPRGAWSHTDDEYKSLLHKLAREPSCGNFR